MNHLAGFGVIADLLQTCHRVSPMPCEFATRRGRCSP